MSSWQSEVRALLSAGYGVEDIAVKLSVSPSSIREMVKIMRRNGVLDAMFLGVPTNEI
jgi:DNA-binding NarL/FixJ family response regulator